MNIEYISFDFFVERYIFIFWVCEVLYVIFIKVMFVINIKSDELIGDSFDFLNESGEIESLDLVIESVIFESVYIMIIVGLLLEGGLIIKRVGIESDEGEFFFGDENRVDFIDIHLNLVELVMVFFASLFYFYIVILADAVHLSEYFLLFLVQHHPHLVKLLAHISLVDPTLFLTLLHFHVEPLLLLLYLLEPTDLLLQVFLHLLFYLRVRLANRLHVMVLVSL